jgi:hypothetical protein
MRSAPPLLVSLLSRDRRGGRTNHVRAICGNVVGWLGINRILTASRRRAIQGGSYGVVLLLTRTVLWPLSIGTPDMEYSQASADTTGGHVYAAPALFTPQTPIVTYQGMTDQVILSRTRGCLRSASFPRLEQTRNALRSKLDNRWKFVKRKSLTQRHTA